LHWARQERASNAWTELQREHSRSSRLLKNSYEGMFTSPLGQEKLSREKKEEYLHKSKDRGCKSGCACLGTHPTSTFADKRCHLPYIYCRQINQRDLQLCTSTVNGLSQHLPIRRFCMVQRYRHSRLLHHIMNLLRSTVRALYITTSSRKPLYLSPSTQLS